jgi:endonuclease/exonuclease/phosphatase (EEP) superfamily protein YafD
VLLTTVVILVFGFLDFRLGIRRTSASTALDIRLLTHNLGFSHVTAASLDALLRAEQVDVAVLQECPFYSNEPARFGWHFFYGGDLCIASRFPFTVLDARDPANLWRRHDRTPLRIEVTAPFGHFQLLNVHLETIRGGLRALGRDRWRGVRRFEANRAVAWNDSRAARARTYASNGPLLIAGDFNLPAESAIYRDNWSDFTNVFSACGRGFGYTKFTRVFGIRIDHVLMSEGWECVDARVLQSPYGGDHAPLLVRLQRRDGEPQLKPRPTYDQSRVR